VNLSLRHSILSVLLVSGLLSGCGGQAPDALLASAKEYLARQDTKAAIIQLKSALQKQPDMAEARFLLGRTLLDAGDPVAAEIELRKALDLKYSQAAVLPALTRALVLEGKGQRAIQEFASTELAESAATAEFKVALATAYAQQGASAQSSAALNEALVAVPGFGPALLLQARQMAGAGRFDEALALLDEVLAKNPVAYEALGTKGELLFFAKGDADGALKLQRQALTVRKDWMPAHASVIDILLSRRDTAAAKSELDALKKILPNHPQTKYYEAQLAALSNDPKTAKEIAQQLLKVAPENVKVLTLAGAIEMQGGSLLQAESLLAKALQIAPEVAQTRRLLAQVYLQSGQSSKASATIALLLEKSNVDADTLAMAGQIALQAGDAALAEGYFGRAAKLDPKDSRSRTALALAQFSKGNADAAYSQLQEIAATDSGTIADMAIISARMRQRDFVGALKGIDGLERKEPNKPLTSQLRGQVQLAQDDIAAARQSFAKALSTDPTYFPAAASLATLEVRDKKPEEARKHFDKLLAADPKNVQALLAIAELRAQAGASKEEIAGLLSNAIKLNPTAVGPRLLLVELGLRSKDNKAALTAAQDGVAVLPESIELLDALGRAQLASGDTNQAISSFNKVAGLRPRAPQPQMRLAEAHMFMKNSTAAREGLNRALDITPKFLPAQRSLLILELSEGRPDAALAIARQVQAERSDEGVGYLFAGDIESSRKNWEAAATAYRAGLKRSNGSGELASKLYSVLFASKKRTEADSFAAAWVKEHPQDLVFRMSLGSMASARRDFVAAEDQFQAVVKAQPDNAIALNNLAWATHQLKKPGAVAYAEKANALRPGEPAFMDTLAAALGDAGQVAKGIELEKKAILLAPEQMTFRLNLAKLYLKAGDKNLAKSELDQLAKLGDKFTEHAEVGELLKLL
jgi:putative PEP-CTERM system TPR-repeat lipoprotein